jgi:hypothetical protein
MIARSQLRDHTTIDRVLIYLAMQGMSDDPLPGGIDSRCGLIA